MANKRGREGRVQGRGVLRIFFFDVYALLATQFPSRRRRIRRRQGLFALGAFGAISLSI